MLRVGVLMLFLTTMLCLTATGCQTTTKNHRSGGCPSCGP